MVPSAKKTPRVLYSIVPDPRSPSPSFRCNRSVTLTKSNYLTRLPLLARTLVSLRKKDRSCRHWALLRLRRPRHRPSTSLLDPAAVSAGPCCDRIESLSQTSGGCARETPSPTTTLTSPGTASLAASDHPALSAVRYHCYNSHVLASSASLAQRPPAIISSAISAAPTTHSPCLILPRASDLALR